MPRLRPVFRRITERDLAQRLARDLLRQRGQVAQLEQAQNAQATALGDTQQQVATALDEKAPDTAPYVIGQTTTGLANGRVVTNTPTITWDMTTPLQAKSQVPDNAITYPIIQDISAASRLLGRGSAAGAGDPQELTVSTGLLMSGTALQVSTTLATWNAIDYTTGTFTMTGTGFVDPDPAVAARWVKLGALVALYIPSISGTSDATTFTLTGLPAGLTPLRQSFHVVRITDNGTTALGYIFLNVSSTILQVFTLGAGTWTASGTKQLFASFITYTLF